jgi:hypothetical protein
MVMKDSRNKNAHINTRYKFIHWIYNDDCKLSSVALDHGLVNWDVDMIEIVVHYRRI